MPKLRPALIVVLGLGFADFNSRLDELERALPGSTRH
jgi:hypothetical protein